MNKNKKRRSSVNELIMSDTSAIPATQEIDCDKEPFKVDL